MLDISGVTVVLGAFASVSLLWWFALFVRPNLAKQRLEIQAQALRDELVDARRRGEVVCDDEHVDPLLEYFKAVTVGGDKMTLVSSIVLWRTLHHEGVEVPTDEVQHEDGCRIAEFEQRLDGLVWDHLISSSRLWFVLEPARFLKHTFGRDSLVGSEPEEIVTPAQRPSLLASGWRMAAEGDQGRAARTMTLHLLDDPEFDSSASGQTPPASHQALVGV